MKKIILILLAGLFGTVADARDSGRSLLRDRGFAKGFHILSPERGKRVVEKTVLFRGNDQEPVWDIAQWSSRYSLAETPLTQSDEGAFILSDAAKRVVVGETDGQSGSIILGIDSRKEYDRARRLNEPWPHLLIQQKIQDCPTLDRMRSLRLTLQARMRKNERFKCEGYDAGKHCAQCPLVLIVQDCNPDSPGFRDFLWFSVPTFDDRWASPPPHIAEDTADPSAKLIYNPGLKAFTEQVVTADQWFSLDVDLLPHVQRAIRTGWEKGYLQQSKSLGDFRIVSFILGWEVPGVNLAEIEFRNLDLRVEDAPVD